MQIKKWMILPLMLMFCTSLVSILSTPVMAGIPPQNELFVDMNMGVGHTFAEKYWDINVFNNSKWSNPYYDDHNWLNHTWNVKWINEGDFEMGMVSFINYSGDAAGSAERCTIYSPLQFWWMHYFYQGHEAYVANLLSAWFGWDDANSNRAYDAGELIVPEFLFTVNDSHFRNDSLFQPRLPNPNNTVIASPMVRTATDTKITYTWSFNYTDMCQFTPCVDPVTHDFPWGFKYEDIGSYFSGSVALSIFDFVYYKFTLVLDSTLQRVKLYSDYIYGDIEQCWVRNAMTDPYIEVDPRTAIPAKWTMCSGNWAYLLSGTDPQSTYGPGGQPINATTTQAGLSTVHTTVGGEEVFNYDFGSKPTYTMRERGNPSNSTVDNAMYGSVGYQSGDGFLNFIAGMSQLAGNFTMAVGAYAINQTNRFTGGVPYDLAFQAMNPNIGSLWMYMVGYPKYGEYCGGRLEHDPVYVAFWTPPSEDPNDQGIPGTPVEILLAFTFLGIAFIVIHQRRSGKR